MVESRGTEQKETHLGRKTHPGISVLWSRAKQQAFWSGVELEHRRQVRKTQREPDRGGTEHTLLALGVCTLFVDNVESL